MYSVSHGISMFVMFHIAYCTLVSAKYIGTVHGYCNPRSLDQARYSEVKSRFIDLLLLARFEINPVGAFPVCAFTVVIWGFTGAVSKALVL